MKPLLILAVAWTALAGSTAQAEAPSKPNVVIILADDMGHGHVSCLNPQSKISTPNIDRLAREGITLTDAHSGSAVCSPTRYGLLTGRYAWRTRLVRGVLGPYDPPLIEKNRLTLPRRDQERLRGASRGGQPLDRPFDAVPALRAQPPLLTFALRMREADQRKAGHTAKKADLAFIFNVRGPNKTGTGTLAHCLLGGSSWIRREPVPVLLGLVTTNNCGQPDYST